MANRRRVGRFVLFFTLFISIYALLNYFVLAGFALFLGLKRSLLFYILLVVLSFSYILATSYERKKFSALSKLLYVASAVWMGFLLFLFCSIILVFLLRIFVDIPGYLSAIIAFGVGLVVVVYVLMNARVLKIKKVKIKIGAKLKAVQLSDIHIGPIREKQYLKEAVDVTNSLKPDIVFITGDLVDGGSPIEKGMFDAINDLKMPVYFITGNHEFYEGFDKVFNILKSTKAKILKDEKINFKGVQILGVNYSTDKDNLKNVLPKLKIQKNKPSILLYHVPKGYEYANNNGVSVMFSGHTHAGQIFPFSLLVRLAYKFTNGLYKYKKMQIYVSPGTGTWGPPMRLGSRNEITLIEFY